MVGLPLLRGGEADPSISARSTSGGRLLPRSAESARGVVDPLVSLPSADLKESDIRAETTRSGEGVVEECGDQIKAAQVSRSLVEFPPRSSYSVVSVSAPGLTLCVPASDRWARAQ